MMKELTFKGIEHFNKCCQEFIKDFCCMGLIEYKLILYKASKEKILDKPKEVKFCPFCSNRLSPLKIAVDQIWMHPFTLHNWIVTEIDNSEEYPIRALDMFTNSPNRFSNAELRGWKFVK